MGIIWVAAIVIMLGLSVVLLAGCEKKATGSTYSGSEIAGQPGLKPTPQPIAGPAITAKPEKCESTISQDYITHIDLNLFKEGLNKTEEGFSFRVIPLDMGNNTVPATGNVGLTIFSTKLWNNELVKDMEIYKKSAYLKKEEVSPDCSSKEIFIKFSDIKEQPNYRFVKEDDPGWLRIEFKRSYSNDLYEIEYNPSMYGEDILP